MSRVRGRESLHGEDVPWRSSSNAQARMIEHAASLRIVLPGNVDACLLIQPPAGQSEIIGDARGFLQDYSVRDKQGVDITRHAVGVIGERHSGSANDKYVRDHASSEQTLAQGSECPLKLGPAKQDATGLAHAASRSLADR